VLFLHAAMVQGGHEEWLKNVLDGAFNRPISLQPFGQWSLRAACGVGPLVDSRASNGAPRLASHPAKTAARPLGGREYVPRSASARRSLSQKMIKMAYRAYV
ncbi:MAG TPA: hypothetical protein PLX86_11170, partial [Acidovorax defluvii]|nr:hypothetical protein [Acidovorax defluvii]